LKRSTPNEQYASIDFDHQSELNSLDSRINIGSSSFKRQEGLRITKKEPTKFNFIDFIMQVHAQAIIDMTTTTLKKKIIMEEQSIIFIVLDYELVKVKEHFMLQRKKKLQKLQSFKPPLQFKQRQALPKIFQDQQFHLVRIHTKIRLHLTIHHTYIDMNLKHKFIHKFHHN
jgi:hypothetical protein